MTLDSVLRLLKSVADESRLRLLAICARGEFTVSDFVQILGQSQPRVSRHLKILCDAGLLERVREGNWVFYRLVNSAEIRSLTQQMLALIPATDTRARSDQLRLSHIKDVRLDAAEQYFQQAASEWVKLRSLHVEDLDVERALCELVGKEMPETLLDIGTGTGRILEILAPFLTSGEGVDLSPEMLSVARTNLDKPGLEHCRVRQGNMYHLPYEDAAFDYVTLHQVLHFAGQPADVVAEISRVLRLSGTAVIIDFAPHNYEEFREEFQHRRLGFSDVEIHGLLSQFHLKASSPVKFPGRELTVSLWIGRKI
ncbi:MAG: metalloregulator ArsR/SmtB family transcription factor [Rhodospirillales bacterium]|nr:metalloregulator ArsR/SmtB family transcription factor [Rhodospirillales bacterium]